MTNLCVVARASLVYVGGSVDINLLQIANSLSSQLFALIRCGLLWFIEPEGKPLLAACCCYKSILLLSR